MNEATSFHDAFADTLRHDSIVGNPRMLSAPAFLRGEVKASGARLIPFIGCGIGWSSHERARQASEAEVYAIDGTLDVWQLKSVWNPRDDCHAVVRRRAGGPALPFPRRTKLGRVLARPRAWTRGPARG